LKTIVYTGSEISSDSPYLFLGLGSCFVEHFETLASQLNIPYSYNPLGTSFNPISIARQLEWCSSESILLSNTIEYQGEWHEMEGAYKFRNTDLTTLKSIINNIQKEISMFLQSPSRQVIIIISLGTAHAWYLQDDLVNNCHKLPSQWFKRKILSFDEIVRQWEHTLSMIPSNWKIIFTISPVRYTKLGLTENFLGKSILRTSIAEIIRKHPNTFYFPSYEIITDELRDYKYFNELGTHPTQEAAEVVMKRFKSFLSL
jgi:hypothetical protein